MKRCYYSYCAVESNKKSHLDGEYVVSDDDEGVGQHKKGAGLEDDQSVELHEEETRQDEELYEEEEEVNHEVEAEDFELDQETGLEEDKQAAPSSSSM